MRRTRMATKMAVRALADAGWSPEAIRSVLRDAPSRATIYRILAKHRRRRYMAKGTCADAGLDLSAAEAELMDRLGY